MTRFTIVLIITLSTAGFAYESASHIKADLSEYIRCHAGGGVVACKIPFDDRQYRKSK